MPVLISGKFTTLSAVNIVTQREERESGFDLMEIAEKRWSMGKGQGMMKGKGIQKSMSKSTLFRSGTTPLYTYDVHTQRRLVIITAIIVPSIIHQVLCARVSIKLAELISLIFSVV